MANKLDMYILGISLLIGFLTVLIGGPFARRYLLSSGIYGIDQQKPEKPKIATSGGLLVLFGFIISVTGYLGLTQLFSTQNFDTSLVLAALNSATIIALIGLVDDIHIDLGELVSEHVGEEVEIELENQNEPATRLIWEKIRDVKENGSGQIHRIGLGQFPKMLFVLPAAFPLIAVGAGSWTMYFPIIGAIEWGLIYPLVLLPVGLLFVSNVVNMLAGTNGLSAGLSTIAALALGLFAFLNGKIEAMVIAFSLASSLIAFLYYNRFPASLLPGDSLTYLSGAALFSVMVIGDMEKFGIFLFIPWILEFCLKARNRFNAHSWGRIQSDGSLDPGYRKTYSLTHPLMRKGLNEKQVTLTLVSVEAVIAISAILIFSPGLL